MENDREKFKNDFKKRLYLWTLKLIKIVDGVSGKRSSEIICKQLLRSGMSVVANYIEAQAASSRKDFTNFLNHSLKSANESKLWVTLLRDTKVVSDNNFSELINELDEISKILASSIITLRNK